ncbi:glycosyltransferase family 2 protein [Gemmatimonas sp.]|jgi:GT2 family glycosyltransferase|uniref:glycosyltransferase family 2 protein n=1 Tax=Gemmatimonas sp. TaxID=1962908 RepID=UPI0037C0DE19
MALPHSSRPDADATPSISVIACTRNRAERLGDFFAALQTLKVSEPWQLVLVDSASTDSTHEQLRRFADSFGPHCSVQRATRKGLGHARNVGLRAATAPVVAFFDDDCYAAPDYLAQVLTCFREQPSLGYLGGRIELFDPNDLPVTIKTSLQRQDFPARALLRAGEIHGANMAFRRDFLQAIGGFDEDLGAGTPFPCEDIDALARLSLAGVAGAYDPRPLVYHHHGRKSTNDFETLMRGYDAGRGAFFAKMLVSGHSIYLRPWLSRIRHQPLATTGRELASACRWAVYVLGRMFSGRQAS